MTKNGSTVPAAGRSVYQPQRRQWQNYPMPGIADHLLVLFFTVLLPLRGSNISWPQLRALSASHEPHPRTGFYRQTIALHVLMLVLALLAWSWAGRPVGELGLAIPDVYLFGFAMFIVLLALVGHWAQARLGLRGKEARSRNLHRLGKLKALMPHSRRERREFALLGTLAGLSEEVMYRGFLTAYLAAFVPLAAAALISVLLFGLGHAYQGWRGIVYTTAIGAALMALYLWSGSLWPGIVFHAGFNVISGRIGHLLVRRDPR